MSMIVRHDLLQNKEYKNKINYLVPSLDQLRKYETLLKTSESDTVLPKRDTLVIL